VNDAIEDSDRPEDGQVWHQARARSVEFWTEERCHITELLNDGRSPEVSLALARVEPGVTTQLHRLVGIAERYLVRRGIGLLEVGGVPMRLVAGDAACIPPGAAQRITNDGEEDLEFYCLCTPRFRPGCYEPLE
jgi:mannose-6-phosphate isomerase-like protein (cupin superfamily)